MNRLNSRSLQLESLESRQLMAGNVTVNLVAGEAKVVGDGQANGVWIREISEGKYRVEGLPVAGVKTTVNGKAFADIFTRQDDLRVFMGGGNDQLLIGNKDGAGTMTVEDLTIDTGDGADYVALRNLNVYDRSDPCKITMGSESKVERDELEATNCSFLASVDIVLGAGDDEVEIRNTTVRTNLQINAGSGKDEVELDKVTTDQFFINLGSGNGDKLEVGNSTARKFNADGGTGTSDTFERRTGNRFTSQSIIGFEKKI